MKIERTNKFFDISLFDIFLFHVSLQDYYWALDHRTVVLDHPREWQYYSVQTKWSLKNDLDNGIDSEGLKQLKQQKAVSSEKLTRALAISRTSAPSILRNYLGIHAYKVHNETILINDHKGEGNQFAHWIQHNFRREDTTEILFLKRTFSTLMASMIE